MEGGSAMHTTTVRDARNNIAKLLRLVQNGDEVIIRSRHVPVAKLVPYTEPARKSFPDLTAFRAKTFKKPMKRGDSTADVRADRDGRG